MNLEFDREALIATFLDEAREMLALMEESLVTLEKHPASDDLLNEVFRAAHTLKGSAACVGFDAVVELAHRVEDVLDLVRSRALAFDSSAASTLLSAVDALKLAVRSETEGDASLSHGAIEVMRELAKLQARVNVSAATAGVSEDSSLEAAAASGSRSLRVDVRRLDRLVDLTGEIAIARGRMRQLVETGASRKELLDSFSESDRLYIDLQDVVMQSRMVPLGPTLRQHARTVRDIAAATGKEARLVLEGEEVEIDTSMVEHLRGPLTHMIRNAVDHGIEPPEERVRLGKEASGTIRVRASHDRGSVRIEVIDDGAGIDRTAVLERATALGLVAPEARLSEAQVDALLFQPGFSTASTVTASSGRGMGMDVVRRNVETVHGRVEIESEHGQGTTITIHLPLTLAIIDGFTVAVSGETYIIPLESVLECLAFERGTAEDEQALTGVTMLHGERLPFVRLRSWFGLAGRAAARENLLVVRHGSAQAGLVVDELHGNQQIVVKPLARIFDRGAGISASALTGTGRVALILDVATLLRAVENAASEAVVA
ncbi:MAG: two-component system, chemotaxis family, sensor kinase CheA [Acidobacteriota bacterium]|nr:two-component system, chemotaxis family, sensor kinase CheA [Acidobacteriota bacterium]